MTPPREHLLTAGVAAASLFAALQEGLFSATSYSGAALALWWVVLLALGFGILPRERLPRAALGAGALLFALAVWFGISMTWSPDAGRAYEGAIRTLAYAGLFAVVVVMSRRGEIRPWLHGLAIALVAVALIALTTRVVPSLAADETLVRLVPSAEGRLSYPIGYWNGLAAMMALAIVMLAWLGAAANSVVARAAATSLLPLPALVIYLASSRGGVAATIAGLAALLAVGTARTRTFVVVMLGAAGTAALVAFAHSKDRLLEGEDSAVAADQGLELLFAILVVTALVLLTALLLDRPLRSLAPPPWLRFPVLAAVALAVAAGIAMANPAERWEEFKEPPLAPVESEDFITSHLTSGSGSGRYQFWSSALDAFEREPVAGIGGGGYESWWTQRAPFSYSLQNAHSLFLETFGELGVAGGMLLLAFFATCIAPAVRAPRNGDLRICIALIAAGLTSAAIDWTWQLPAVFGPVIVACALLAVPARTEKVADPQPESLREHGSPAPLRIAGGALAVAGLLASALLLFGASRLEESRDAAADGDYETALEAARGAAAIQPWAAEPRLQEGLVLERLGAWDPAIEAVGEARKRAPQDWRPFLVLSRLQLRAGRGPAALRSLRRARSLNPESPLLAR